MSDLEEVDVTKQIDENEDEIQLSEPENDPEDEDEDLMKKVHEFTYDKCYEVAKKGLSKSERGIAFAFLTLRGIYLLCFLFYIKLNLKMWMRDGVMTKLAWKFGSITVLIVISALDHLIQQPSGKRKWLILIYLLIPVLWYLQSIA